jgi:tight adherence protein C
VIAVLLGALAGAACGAGAGELVLARSERRERRPPPGAPGRLSWDLGLLGPLLWLARRVGRDTGRRLPAPTDATSRLDAAGLSPRIAAADLRAGRGAAATIGLGSAVAGPPVLGAGAVLLAAVTALALALLPDLLIARRIRARGGAMLEELPDVLDLLRIALRSGRSVPETLARVGAHHPGALGAELRRTAAEMRIGVPTEDALVGLRRRCPAEGAPELVALLLRNHRHGGSSLEGLASLAEDLRARRARAAIDRASRAAPKVQLVVALLLVPAAMLLIAATLLQTT